MATDTIFNPKDDTLKERFNSFEYVNACYMRDKANLDKTGDFLGESEEIKEAFTLSRNSLKQAHKSISDSELKQAFSEGLIDNAQVKNFKQSKNILEMENRREASLENKYQSSTRHQAKI
jgi:hypothetical protein